MLFHLNEEGSVLTHHRSLSFSLFLPSKCRKTQALRQTAVRVLVLLCLVRSAYLTTEYGRGEVGEGAQTTDSRG